MPNKTGDFLPLQLTNIGRDMLTQGRAGHVLTFTKVAIGEGTATGTAVDSLTALKSHKLYLPIAKNETVHAGQMRLQFRVNNKVVTSGFYFREIGLYAKVDNGEEKLYAYTTCGDKARMIYDNTYPIQERVVNIDTVTDNAPNVRVILDWSIVYATQKDIIDMIKPHKELTELDHPDESVTTRKLKDKSVTLPKLADDVNDLLQKTYVKKSGDTMTGNLTLTNNSELFIAATGGNHSISNNNNNLNLGNPSITKESNLCSKNRPNWDNGTDKKLIALEEDVINETRKYLPLTGGNLTGDLNVATTITARGKDLVNPLNGNAQIKSIIDWDKMKQVYGSTMTSTTTIYKGQQKTITYPKWCTFDANVGAYYFNMGNKSIYLIDDFTNYDEIGFHISGGTTFNGVIWRKTVQVLYLFENFGYVNLGQISGIDYVFHGFYQYGSKSASDVSTKNMFKYSDDSGNCFNVYGVKY